jgi:hypothetical protein
MKRECLALLIVLAFALSASSQASAPAASGLGMNVSQEAESEPAAAVQEEEDQPVAGIKPIKLETSHLANKYMTVSLQASQVVDNSYAFNSANSDWQPMTVLSGKLDLHRTGRNQGTDILYYGGATIYNTDSQFTSSFHELATEQRFNTRNWRFLLGNNFSFFPESPFGNTAFGLPGGQGPGFMETLNVIASLYPGLPTSELMLTDRGPRYSNTTVGQIEYLLTPRTALTVNGSYGVLRFLNSTVQNSDMASVSVGLSRELTKMDSIGVNYTEGRMMFGLMSQRLVTRAVTLSYLHHVNSRLLIEFIGGPQTNQYRDELSTSSRDLFWNGGARMQYRFKRSEMSLQYSRLVSGGSGILPGSANQLVFADLTAQLNRKTSVSLGGGYSRNTALSNSFVAGDLSGSFNSAIAAVGVSRTVGRSLDYFLRYSLQQQIAPSCIQAIVCAVHTRQHTFEIGFNYHLRPMRIQ